MQQTRFESIKRAPLEGFDVDQFKSYIERIGLQRTNRFLVRFFAPASMATEPLFLNIDRELEFYCMASSLPGYGVELHQVLRYGYGLNEKKPFAPIVNDLTCVFFSDAEGRIHKFFTSWINAVINKNYNAEAPNSHGVRNQNIDPFEAAYKIDYMTNIQITTFSDSGKISNRNMLLEAYPIVVPDIQLNWGENNNIMAIPVTFTFYSWHSQQIV